MTRVLALAMTNSEKFLLAFGVVFFTLALALIGAMAFDLVHHPTAGRL